MSADEIFAAFPTLSTPRLTLHQIRTEDASAVFGLYADAEVTRYYNLGTFTEPLQAEELIERFQRRFDHRIGLRWGLALNETPDNLIGTCGYNIWVQPARRGLVGYDLARNHWHRGLMAKALAAVLKFGFTAMGINRVEALTFAQNTASKSLLDTLGFQVEGLLREYEFIERAAQDLAIYSLLARERSQ